MSAAATQFTIADLERMPDDGMHREIVDGELIELPPAKPRHSRVTKRIFTSLLVYEQTGQPVTVYMEAGFKLMPGMSHWLQPDVSVVTSDREHATSGDEYFAGGPEVAIEVISPSESAADVLAKTIAYLEAGTKVVVNIYPRSRDVTVHLPDGSGKTLRGKDVLTLPDVLPGWEMSLAEIFGEKL